jgi:hypothetical protein
MRSIVAGLFGRERKVAQRPCRRKSRSGIRPARERFHSPSVQPLEERLALAINAWQFPFGSAVTSGSTNWATLVVDDGDNTFLKKNATPSPSFTFANNDQFTGSPIGGVAGPTALSIGELSAGFGQLTSFYVTSGTTEPSPGVLPNPAFGKVMPYSVNSGSFGIVPGTFSASMAVTDGDGNSGTVRILAEPGVGSVPLRFERVSGDCAVPLGSSRLGTLFGTVTLQWAKAPTAVTLVPFDWANYDAGVDPISFTLYPGQTPSQRLGVDFQQWVPGSSISIDSPIASSLGSASDPFFSGFGGIVATGQLQLQADTVTVRANASSSSIFSASAINLNVNRPVAAPIHGILINASAGNPGRLSVSEQGALANSLTTPATTASGSIAITAQHADIVFAGTVNATAQTYLMQSVGDPRAYALTTVSPTTGVQSGRIYGDTIGMTLANDAGGDVDVQTQIANLRMTAASTPTSPVLPYAIRVLEANDLVVDAVPASARGIAITAGGTLTLTSAIQTSGDLTLVAKNNLKLSAPVSSATGTVAMVSDSLTSSSTITAGGTRGVTFTSLSATGDVDVNALVRAGGLVKQPVRLATVADVTLSGPQTVDGVAIATGDRVLVKNQAIPSENGIYVVDTGGIWTRTVDANLSGLFTPGFSVFVTEGSQMGGWSFANPTNPTLDSTGILFVPVSATQTYAPVVAATTADILLSGLQTVDGVVLLGGERVLVKDQVNRRQNGIYVVSSGAWQRAGDADMAAELRAGSYVFVEPGGTVNGSQGFVLDDDAVQVGVTQLNFSSFAVQTTRTNTYSPANVLASVVAATTANIDLSAAHTTIDGQSLVLSDLVLVKNQINAAQNGVYQVQAGGVLARWTGADSAGELARGTTVYVTGGAVNGTTSWTFNDTDAFLGSITAGNQVVTGLVSTSRLAIGMLVTGPGIPSGTTISGINSSTSIRLSKPVTLTDPSVALSFMEVSAVAIGTTPIVFAPTGGAVVITAGRSVTSTAATPTSRLQGATALLSAGRPQSGTVNTASAITANTNVGRLSAGAPAAIAIDNSNAVDLVRIGTSKAGPIAVTASGTLTVLDVLATGTVGTPGTVTLLSTFGNVVAAGVTSTLGDISLTAATGDVRVTQVTSLGSPASAAGNTYAGNVTAQAGSVTVTANESPGSTTGDIVIDGRLVSDGAGSDIILKTSVGSVTFTSTAFVNAKDQLLINTPQAEVAVNAGAQIAASRLSLTAELGAGTSPPAALGNYQSLFINRTDVGDVVYTTTSSLTIEGAVTKDGSIAFTAPDITVAGDILPNGTSKEISLHATAGDLKIDAALTASGNIRLKAPAGEISNSAGATTPLLSSPLSLFVEAATGAYLATKVTSLDATLSGIGAVLEVTETDSLVIERVLLSGGGTADLKIGSPAAGGSATVKSIDVGATTGTLKLLANENIVEGGTPTVADIVANRAELTATLGKIDVDTDVNVLLASAIQKNQAITIDDLGANGLELQSVQTNNADISVTAKGQILATSVTTAGKISLATSDAGADILVGNLVATGNTITLAARGSILEATPADPTADITATTVTLTATDGSIDVHLAASAVAATATTVGSSINIKDDNDLTIGDAATGITGQAVTITVGDGLTQTKAIVAESLAVTATTGVVTLETAANNVNSLTVSGTKAVSFQDIDGLDIGAAGISGGVITLKVGGTLTQTGKIAGTSLAITSSSGNVTLANTTNDVGSLAVTLTGLTAGRTITYTDANALAIGVGGIGITGGDVAITTLTGTGITVNAPVLAGAAGAGDGNILLKATAGDINFASTLTAKGDTITLDASNGAIIRTSPGSIECQTLVWYAKTAPAPSVFSIPPNKYNVVSPNLTGSGDIEIGPTAGTLTVAGASTADGNIKITGDDVIITGLVQAGGVDNAVTVTADTGSIDFQTDGQIVNALGSVSLNATNGAVTATNAGTKTSVTAQSLTLTAKNNSLLTTTVGSVSGAVTAGDLTLSETDGLVVGALAGNVISLFTGGPVTQTPGTAIKAFLLAVTNTAGAITLTNAANDVDWLTVDNGNRSVAFTDVDELSIGGSGIMGGNSGGGVGVDITATTIGVNAPITSGAAVAGNGDIRLKATTGNIWLTQPTSLLTAKDDTITLDASNGTIIQSAGLIDCQTLVWIANTVPTFLGTPPNTYTVVAPNLTGSGDINIGPAAGTLTVAGASTADGNITIIGDAVIITGLIQTNGVDKSVTVTANTGDIDFQSDGRIVNALGSVSLDAVNGAVTATNAGSQTSVTAESLAIAARNDSSLTTAVGALSGNISAGNLTLVEADGVEVGTLAGTVISLLAGGTITQTPSTAINAFLLAVTNTAGDVILSNADNDVDWLTITNDDRAVSFTDQNDFAVGGNGITGGDITLHAGNIIGQTVAIVGTSLTVSSDTGVLYLDNSDNDVDTLTVNNGNRTVLFTDIDALEIGAAGINGGVIVLSVGGDLTQTGAISGFLLVVTATDGSVSLDDENNDIDWLTIDNGNRAVSFTDRNDFAVGGNGITGGDITLHAGNIIGQTMAIIGASLTVSSDTGVLYLDNSDNDVDSLTVNNGNRTVLFTDIDELEIGAAGLNGGVIVLTAGGDLTQTGQVLGFLLAVTATAGSVVLTNPDNDVDWLTITNDDRAISFTDQNAFAVGGNGITGGDITLSAGSTLAQTVAIVGNSLTASSDSGVVSLTNPNNDVNSLTVNNGNRAVSFTDRDELSVDGITGGTLDLRVGGNLAVSGIVTISGNATITTTAGGGVDVGPIPNSLLQAGGTLDLRNVQGQIGMRNNGRIEGSPVLVVPGTIIDVGGTITTANDLDQSVATINSLPIIVGGRYGILIGANIALTQSLTVTRPLSLQGTSQAITLFGSGSVRNGLVLGATASNSLVRDLTFAGFADDAIRLTDNTNTSIMGLRIRDSGYGLTVTGTSTGTVAQGNVFNRNATGVRLLSATGVLIGGSVAGQGNTISNATREGVFAQGFCTNSRVVRNTITGTAVPYNTTQSRNLTVVP